MENDAIYITKNILWLLDNDVEEWVNIPDGYIDKIIHFMNKMEDNSNDFKAIINIINQKYENYNILIKDSKVLN